MEGKRTGPIASDFGRAAGEEPCGEILLYTERNQKKLRCHQLHSFARGSSSSWVYLKHTHQSSARAEWQLCAGSEGLDGGSTLWASYFHLQSLIITITLCTFIASQCSPHFTAPGRINNNAKCSASVAIPLQMGRVSQSQGEWPGEGQGGTAGHRNFS